MAALSALYERAPLGISVRLTKLVGSAGSPEDAQRLRDVEFALSEVVFAVFSFEASLRKHKLEILVEDLVAADDA